MSHPSAQQVPRGQSLNALLALVPTPISAPMVVAIRLRRGPTTCTPVSRLPDVNGLGTRHSHLAHEQRLAFQATHRSNRWVVSNGQWEASSRGTILLTGLTSPYPHWILRK